MNLLRIYKLYSIIVWLTGYITLVSIWATSSMQGLATGHYFVMVETDVLGENWLEIVILLTALPGILYVSLAYAMRLAHQKEPAKILEESSEKNPHQTIA